MDISNYAVGPRTGRYEDQTSPAPKIPMVSDHMLTIERQASDLRELVGVFEQRLTMVLRAAPPEAVTNGAKVSAQLVPLCGQMAAASEVLAAAQRQMQSLLDRLEV